MLFIIALALTAGAIASTAAYFSIVGLASIFPGSFIPVIIMATVLEVGKLVSVSFLYRYWEHLSLWIRCYLTAAISTLMLITSLGIFGMLAVGHQQDALPLKEIDAAVSLLTQEKQELLERKKQIDGIVAAINPNFVSKRIEQQEKFSSETNRINNRLPELTKEIRELTNKKINQEVHTGPITFIAKALGKEIDDATKWMIFLIIFAFDPLAVILTIGTNMAILMRKEDMEATEPNDTTDYSVDNEVDEPTPAISSAAQLRSLLDELSEKKEHELTDEEKAEKAAIGEYLAHKQIKQKVRNSTLNG